MFSFQGDFKKQRNINLGGRRKHDPNDSNTQALLVKAKVERQRREIERKRQKSVELIQHMWKGTHATELWRSSMRESWAKPASLNISSTHPADISDLYSSLADFVAYYKGGSQDAPRLHWILDWLFNTHDEDGLEGSDTAKYTSNYSIIVQSLARLGEESSTKTQSWSILLSRLLGASLRFLANDPTGSATDPDILLRSVQYACATPNPLVQSLENTLPFKVLERLTKYKGFYHHLSRLISHSQNPSMKKDILTAAQLVVVPFYFDKLRIHSAPHFVRWILTIPGLPNKIGVRGITFFAKADIPWDVVASNTILVLQNTHTDKADGTNSKIDLIPALPECDLVTAAINIFGNLAAFITPQLAKITKENSTLEAEFIHAGLICARIIPETAMAIPINKKNIVSSFKIQGHDKPDRVVVDPQALRWLHSVLSVQFLGLLVDLCYHRNENTTDKVNKDSQELLLIFTQCWGETVRNAVLDNILQAVDMQNIGWNSLLHNNDFVSVFSGDRVRISDIESHDLISFQLLCEVLNRQLQTLGDDELFNQGKSLPIRDIKTIARVCRNIAFALHWSQTTPESLVYLRTTATELTRQLYIRDSRHSFTEEGFWLVPPTLMDMASFADQVAEDPIFSEKTHVSLDGNNSENDSSDSDNDEADDDNNSQTPDSDTEMQETGHDLVNERDNPYESIFSRNSQIGSQVSIYSRLARSRQSITPKSVLASRVAILRFIPFVVPFNDRVRLFHALINKDRRRLGLGSLGTLVDSTPLGIRSVAHATVRRGHIFADGFKALYPVLSGRPVESQQYEENADMSVDDGIVNSANEDGFQTLMDFGMMGGFNRNTQMTHDPFGWGLPLPSALQAQSASEQSSDNRSDMFKRRMQISFIDQHGMTEAGIDGGGVFKEFLVSLAREAFNPASGLFNATAQNSLFPNPESTSDKSQKNLTLDKYKFLGAVIGKALYEGVLVDAPFALFFLSRWLNQLPSFNDLPSLDEELYRGLVILKNYPIDQDRKSISTKSDISNDIATNRNKDKDTSNNSVDYNTDEGDEDIIYQVFGLDFTVTSTLNDHTVSVPLVPGGDNIKVTARNRLLYLELVSQYRLIKQIDGPVKAFVAGLHSVIPPVWLQLLFASPQELSRLLCGDSGTIDINDWKRNTVYDGGYRSNGSKHPTIVNFWDVVENSLTERQRQQLCKFATSCERPPLLGFSELNPRFCIRSSEGNDNNTEEQNARLPSASTCVNLLKLPVYTSRGALYEKLVTAIESDSGFDLS